MCACAYMLAFTCARMCARTDTWENESYISHDRASHLQRSHTFPQQGQRIEPQSNLAYFFGAHLQVHGYVGNKSAVFPMQTLGLEVDFVNSVQVRVCMMSDSFMRKCGALWRKCGALWRKCGALWRKYGALWRKCHIANTTSHHELTEAWSGCLFERERQVRIA